MNVTNRYFKYICDLYENYEKEINSFLKLYLGESDLRTSKWPFTKSPIPLLATFTLYYIIAFFGPRIMNSRKPFEIRKILMVYNVGQIWLSSFIMKEIVITCTEVGFSFTCQPVDLSMNPIAIRLLKEARPKAKHKKFREAKPVQRLAIRKSWHKTASCSWWYHISKYVDLLDTVFFVLRKKRQQMTFLHLFHHSTMLFNSYLGMLYLPGGQAIVSTFLNSFVHVIMYWYYLLAAIGPCFHKYLWWKKYLTILQLTQFFTVLAHVFWGSVSGCEVPNWLKFYVICYVSVLIVLFLNFYLSSYKKMSLLKALGCVCFQDHLKKSFEDSKDDPSSLGKEVELTENMLIERNKKKGVKAKSPFTIVNRNAVQDRTEVLESSKLKDKYL